MECSTGLSPYRRQPYFCAPGMGTVYKDDLDKELEKRGHKFVRYADDCNIYVKSRRAGERVMASIRKVVARSNPWMNGSEGGCGCAS